MNIKYGICLSALGSILAAEPAFAELFFSEYIEGSSNNKAVEIYNPSATESVDLSLYKIKVFANGAATANNTINLTGTLAPQTTYVVSNTSAVAAIKNIAQLTSGGLSFNGDDAVTLEKSTVVIDSIGQVGLDPGTEWGTGLTSTADNTLRRKSSISAGDTNASDAFDPAVQWDGFATDTFDGLGSHTLDVSTPATGKPTANAGADQAGVTAGATVTLDGSASSDTDGAIASYAWTQTAGTAVTLSDATAQKPTFNTTGISGTLTFSLTVTDNAGKTSTADTVTITVSAASVSACGTADKKISEVQGNGTASPLVDQTVTIQGVVTKVLPSLSGYMVQEEAADQDADPATSEGVFVYDSSHTPSVGDVVAVKAKVTEYFNLTELTTLVDYAVCGTGSVAPVEVNLPFSTLSDLEKYEGMLVKFPHALTVTETYWGSGSNMRIAV